MLDPVQEAIRESGLSARPVCLHSSFRSFRGVVGEPLHVIDAFLNEGCTLLVPTYSWHEHALDAPDSAPVPERNAYRRPPQPRRTAAPFTPDSTAIDTDAMGAIPTAVVQHPEQVRGAHPLCSFSALGPLAHDLVAGQGPEGVNDPLERLADREGAVVLAGVDLTTMTLLHLAEERAGRRMFVRWGMLPEGIVPVRVGGCSSGFERLADTLAPYERRIEVGPSVWRVFPAKECLVTAERVIAADSTVTRCEDRACERCRDAVRGGPAW